MRSITIPLTPSGLERGAQWLEKYAKITLPKKVEQFVELMTRQGESWAINFMGHIDTGETLASIVGIRNGNKGVIVAGGNAIWIEFGTGVVANIGVDSHPKAPILGIAPHGTYGKGLGSNPNGWYYPDPKGTHYFDGQYWSHTYGIPASRFLYDTSIELIKAYPSMAKEIFEK